MNQLVIMNTVIKYFFIFIAVISTGSSAIAQGIHYQGAARTAEGLPLTNTYIALRATILSEPTYSIEATLYWEVRSLKTNALGMYDFNIGDGKALLSSNNFSSVVWDDNAKYVRIEIDVQNGNNFATSKIVQLSAVPFSMYAKEGGTSGYNYWKAKPENIGKTPEDYFHYLEMLSVLGSGAVKTNNIVDQAITSDKIADQAVNINKLQPGFPGQILMTNNEANAVIWGNLPEVDYNMQGDVIGTLQNNTIKPDAVTTTKIKNQAVTAEKLFGGDGSPNRLAMSNEVGEVTFSDASTIVQNHQLKYSVQNGTHTQVDSVMNGTQTIYKVQVATAKGAAMGNPSSLGLVKEAVVAPAVLIGNDGELLLNDENINQIVKKNNNYTLDATDRIVLGNAVANDITFTLPPAMGIKGRKITIKKLDPNEDFYINVVGDIVGIPPDVAMVYTALPYSGWEFVSDGAQWHITHKF